MISQKIVRMIENSAHECTKMALDWIRNDPSLVAYQRLDPSLLYRRLYRVYSGLSQWLCRRTSKEKLEAHYTDLGRQRFQEGIPLSEVIRALIIIRRTLYVFMDDQGLLFHDPLLMHQVTELTNRVLVFFDRAIYYVACGYEDALANSLPDGDGEASSDGIEQVRRAVTRPPSILDDPNL